MSGRRGNGDDSSQFQSSAGDLGEFTGIEGQSGKNKCQGLTLVSFTHLILV